MRALARAIIRKYHPDVIGVTGSVGKTSAKEAIAAVMAAKFRVRSSRQNFNNEIGVPLTIIGADYSPGRSLWRWLMILGRAIRLIAVPDDSYPEMLVLEMAADKPGDIQYLISFAPCRVGVLTAIAHAHTAAFKTIKKIAQEKRVILSHLKSDDFAVFNGDNQIVVESAAVTKAEKVSYGLKAGLDFQATDLRVMTQAGELKGINFKVNHAGNSVPVFLPEHLGGGSVYAALAAMAVGGVFGINAVEAAEALRVFKPLPGRLYALPGIKGTIILDDTYNASPEAVKVALGVLADLPLPLGGRRYAVLGDMPELGPETEPAHREIGLTVAEKGIDFLITVGEATKDTARAAREGGLPDDQIAKFAEAKSAGKFLQEKLREGDITLVKGSQGMRMERVVKEVMAEPLSAPELLVRQTDDWLKK